MKLKKGPNMKYFSKKPLRINEINKIVKKYELNDALFYLDKTASLISLNNHLSRIGLNEEPIRTSLEKSKDYYEFIYYILEMLRTGILEVK